MRKKTRSQEAVDKEIKEFEEKNGKKVAFKWGGKWVKKEDVLSVGIKK